MFFVCKKVNDKYGIIDTDDGVIEYYTPEQVCALAKKLKIHGVDFLSSGVTIKIVIPKAFDTINSDFYPFSLYDAKQVQGKSAKFHLAGKYFCNMFDDLFPEEVIKPFKTVLILESWEHDEIAFSLKCLTEFEQSKDVMASQIQEIFNNSPYRNYARLANTDDLIKSLYSYGSLKPIVFLKVPIAYKDYIRSQVTDFYHNKNVLHRLDYYDSYETLGKFNFESLICTHIKAHGGFHISFSLFFNYEGLIICLKYRCNLEYIDEIAEPLGYFVNEKLKED